jgi:hypothetical protein
MTSESACAERGWSTAHEGPPGSGESGWGPCPACGGSGSCPPCGGQGCDTCGGSGECRLCMGRGQIPVR